MKFKILIFSLLFTSSFLLFTLAFAQLPTYSLPPLPAGTGYTQGEIQSILIKFANFLIAAGTILGIITIVVSGIMYFAAKSDTDAKKGKAWFKNGIIGAFIILAVGVIILTIYNIVVDRTFFGGGNLGPGQPCINTSQCQPGLTCRPLPPPLTGSICSP